LYFSRLISVDEKFFVAVERIPSLFLFEEGILLLPINQSIDGSINQSTNQAFLINPTSYHQQQSIKQQASSQ
jgi:hypothetical protein